RRRSEIPRSAVVACRSNSGSKAESLIMIAPPVPAVQTYGLTRMYGQIAALSGLDLTVNKGDLFGFIGSNGAGKTTTLRILATFLAPSAGSAQILGHDVVRDADAVRHVIGYMPD